MIGFAYFKNSNNKEDYLAYIPNKGWVKSNGVSFFKKNKHILFITNLSDVKCFVDVKNLKSEFFFNYTFEQIIYYFNISKFDLKYKLKEVSKTLNDTLLFYKENFKKEIKLSDLLDIDYFYEMYDQILDIDKISKIKFPVGFNSKNIEMIHSEEQELINFYLKRNEFTIFKNIINLEVPLSNFEYVSIDEIGDIDNVESSITAFSDEFFLIIKGNLESFNKYNKKLLPKRIYGENSFFFKDELFFINGFSNVKIDGFHLSSDYAKFGDYLKYYPKIKKTRIANRIVMSNYIEKLFNEVKGNEVFHYYIKEKMLSENFKSVCEFKKNEFNVMAYTGSEILVSIKKCDVEKLLKEVEKIDLLYSSDLLSCFQ